MNPTIKSLIATCCVALLCCGNVSAQKKYSEKDINESMINSNIIIDNQTFTFKSIPNESMKKMYGVPNCKYCILTDNLLRIEDYLLSIKRYGATDRNLGEFKKAIAIISSKYPGIDFSGYHSLIEVLDKSILKERAREQDYEDSLAIDMQQKEATIKYYDSVNHISDSLYKIINDSINHAQLAISEKKQAAEQAEFEKLCLKKYGTKMGKLVIKGEIVLGMTKEMCRDAWGSPDKTNETITKGTLIETWYYGDLYSRWLVFNNGKLISKTE